MNAVIRKVGPCSTFMHKACFPLYYEEFSPYNFGHVETTRLNLCSDRYRDETWQVSISKMSHRVGNFNTNKLSITHIRILKYTASAFMQ